jgi:hypothetical protein
VTATVLNWRHHRIGPLRPCRYCQHDAFMRDETGTPAHKVCAEREIHLNRTTASEGLAA